MNVQGFASFHNRLWLPGRLRLETALRVGTGRSTEAVGVDLPVVKDFYDRPYIPGSSFKGALRAYIESVLRGLQERLGRKDLACLSVSKPDSPDYEGCLTQSKVNNMKEEFRDNPQALEQAFWEGSCWVCRVFGAPWLASKVWVRDLTVDEETWPERYEQRDGVAIDRDTGTAAEGFKYEFEAVPPGVVFNFEFLAENASPAEQGLLLLALRGFEEGHVMLGGGRSRGLGRVRLEIDWDGSEYVDEAILLDYLLGTVEKESLRAFADEDFRRSRLEEFLKEAGVKEDA